MNTTAILEAAQAWAHQDPDASTVAELEALIGRAKAGGSEGALADLNDRFAAKLEFGTAGLRGILGAGPNRMNRAVVLRTTHGLATHLLESVHGAKQMGVVVGYDGRRGSRTFAEDAAGVFASFGIPVYLFEDTVPTPVTAFALKHLKAASAVMVTASHNPPEYNGYKVYWENGAQIIPPIDERIAAAIEKAPPAKDVPRLELAEGRRQGLILSVPEAVEATYLDAVRQLSLSNQGDRSISIVYTPMHGVGDATARKAFAQAGFRNVVSVPEQQEPDGAFPTVRFPNPEEKGAMDLAFALGRKLGAGIVLANDPDADRLAVAERSDEFPGGYVQFTGNQVGVLLGHYLLTEGANKASHGVKRLVISSIVSSPMLGSVARALGVRHEETLTGFKWIANRAMDLERDGYRFVFGYEEALGYTVGNVVRDKDGISAAVLVAEMAAVLKERGLSLRAYLEQIHRRYGLFVSSQVTVTRPGAAGVSELAHMMGRIRANAPSSLGGLRVLAMSDFQSQRRTEMASGHVTSTSLPKTDMLMFELEGGSRVIARPSGTEPKAKFYFDVREQIQDGETFGAAEARATETLASLAKAFVSLSGD